VAEKNGEIARRVDGDVEDARFILMEEPEGGPSATIKGAVTIRRRRGIRQIVKLCILLWTDKALVRGGHEESRTGDSVCCAVWVEYGVAGNTASGKRGSTGDTLCVAKISADNGANEVAFVKGAGERAAGVQNDGDNGILSSMVVHVTKLGPVHGHEAFGRDGLGLGVGAVKVTGR
jgi:hypothetical protein